MDKRRKRHMQALPNQSLAGWAAVGPRHWGSSSDSQTRQTRARNRLFTLFAAAPTARRQGALCSPRAHCLSAREGSDRSSDLLARLAEPPGAVRGALPEGAGQAVPTGRAPDWPARTKRGWGDSERAALRAGRAGPYAGPGAHGLWSGRIPIQFPANAVPLGERCHWRRTSCCAHVLSRQQRSQVISPPHPTTRGLLLASAPLSESQD